MYFSNATIDDLLRRVLEKLLATRRRNNPTRGANTELTGVLLQLTNPLSRLSRTEKKGKVFSCLGELLWYLAGSNRLDFIKYYVPRYEVDSEDGVTIHGAYGPRLFNMQRNPSELNQFENVLNLLKRKPTSRRAVIQLFDAADLGKDYREIPCTCTLQFMVRAGRLHMFTSMRSNDAFWGLPHDIFTFTMIQEIMARALNLELGKYKHFVGSLHLYDEHAQSARQFLAEGYQSRLSMPPMPAGDPFPSISDLLKAERKLRVSRIEPKLDRFRLSPYWNDLMQLLFIYRHFKHKDHKKIGLIKKRLSTRVYDCYINEKARTAKGVEDRPMRQLDLIKISHD